MDDVETLPRGSSPCPRSEASFINGSLNFATDPGYASSAYTGSVVDAASPAYQTTGAPMPTLYEELQLHTCPPSQPGLADDALLTQANGGAFEDFGSPNFSFDDGGMSPHTAMLNNFGEGVNCSIIDTGIAAEQVDAYIAEQVDMRTCRLDSKLDKSDKIYVCLFIENGDLCGKDFKRRENAFSHVQNHLDDRQFQCNDCGKTFVRAHDMKRHSIIHTEQRPHVCPCGSGFARHDALTRHRQRGMCKGAFPGFEKREQDKPKRGRPRKDRPDAKSRVAKSKRAREMDRTISSAGNHPVPNSVVEGGYASSCSVFSPNSLPMTPGDTFDFDDHGVFGDMSKASDGPLDSAMWRDTPPTSPMSSSPVKSFQGDMGISPALLTGNTTSNEVGGFHGCASPVDSPISDFHFDVTEAQPGVARHPSFSHPYSPTSCHSATNRSSPAFDAPPPDNADVKGFKIEDFETSAANAVSDWLALH